MISRRRTISTANALCAVARAPPLTQERLCGARSLVEAHVLLPLMVCSRALFLTINVDLLIVH